MHESRIGSGGRGAFSRNLLNTVFDDTAQGGGYLKLRSCLKTTWRRPRGSRASALLTAAFIFGRFDVNITECVKGISTA
jgi:hypothetical protein